MFAYVKEYSKRFPLTYLYAFILSVVIIIFKSIDLYYKLLFFLVMASQFYGFRVLIFTIFHDSFFSFRRRLPINFVLIVSSLALSSVLMVDVWDQLQ